MSSVTENVIFDCSLWADEYPMLARAIARRCNELGFPNLDGIKIPYSRAVAFAGGTGKLWEQMKAVSDTFDLANKEEKRNYHIKMLIDFMTHVTSFQMFAGHLWKVYKKMLRNGAWVNRVYYGLQKDEGGL